MIEKKAVLNWLDKQRAIVNDLIVSLPQEEKKTLMPELQTINAIEVQVREMTAVEFFDALKEIRSLYCADGYCGSCPLSEKTCHDRNICGYIVEYPGRAVEIVKRWKEERDGH